MVVLCGRALRDRGSRRDARPEAAEPCFASSGGPGRPLPRPSPGPRPEVYSVRVTARRLSARPARAGRRPRPDSGAPVPLHADDPRLPRAARGPDRPHRRSRARPGPDRDHDRRRRRAGPARRTGPGPSATSSSRSTTASWSSPTAASRCTSRRPRLRAPVRRGAAHRPRRHRRAPRAGSGARRAATSTGRRARSS